MKETLTFCKERVAIDLNLQGMGVKKVSENILKENRALIITEEDAAKLQWENIPDGTLKINPKTGLMTVKLEGETDWLPTGLKNDGTLCIIKDSMIVTETFTVTSVPEFQNGQYASYTEFTYTNSDGETRHMPITEHNELIFELEKGSYIKNRNHLEAMIDDVLGRSPASGGLREVTETRFAVADQLKVGQEITAKYIRLFRIGNPYPRVFMMDDTPEASELGDLWIDTNESIDDDMTPGQSDTITSYPWAQISGKPDTLAGYGIIDKVSYENHSHKMAEISGLLKYIENLLFKGMIIDFFGKISDIPAGWALCDGNNGTPDLRDKFIVAAGKSYQVGDTGGENTHILTISEMPKHNHKGYEYIGQFGDGDGYLNHINAGTNAPSSNGVSYTGGNQAHENRPPYYALFKIMKI